MHLPNSVSDQLALIKQHLMVTSIRLLLHGSCWLVLPNLASLRVERRFPLFLGSSLLLHLEMIVVGVSAQLLLLYLGCRIQIV